MTDTETLHSPDNQGIPSTSLDAPSSERAAAGRFLSRGYVKLWRKFTDTSFFKNSHCVHLAVYLLLECNHEPHRFLFNGKEENCDRGQLITGLHKLNSATGISIRSLRTCLRILSNVGFLTSKTTNKFRVISIVKYGDYQGKTTSNLTSHRHANDKQTTTNKKNKNEKNGRLIERGTAAAFHPPTLEEVRAYCGERGNHVDPDKWFAHYEANGWRVGRNPMKNWQASVRTWERSNFNSTKPHPGNAAAPLAGKYDGLGVKV